MTQEKLQNKGEQLYDNFLNAIFNNKERGLEEFKSKYVIIPTPRTRTLELFALLDKNKEKGLLIGAMCSEVAKGLNDDGIFVEDGKLFERITTKKPFNIIQ